MSDATWELPGVTHWDGCGDVGAPEHAGCKKRADLPTTRDPGDYAAGFGDGYGRGMTESARQVLACRRILQDLIAELRATAFSQDWATWRLLMEIVEGAEARLAAQE